MWPDSKFKTRPSKRMEGFNWRSKMLLIWPKKLMKTGQNQKKPEIFAKIVNLRNMIIKMSMLNNEHFETICIFISILWLIFHSTFRCEFSAALGTCLKTEAEKLNIKLYDVSAVKSHSTSSSTNVTVDATGRSRRTQENNRWTQNSSWQSSRQTHQQANWRWQTQKRPKSRSNRHRSPNLRQRSRQTCQRSQPTKRSHRKRQKSHQQSQGNRHRNP